MLSGTKKKRQYSLLEAGRTPRLGKNLLYQHWAELTGISESCRNVIIPSCQMQLLVLGQGSKLLVLDTLQPFPDQ